MFVHMMADLVRENDFDLLGGELVEESVAEQDAARATQAGEGGVGLARLLAEVQPVDALDGEPGPRAQPLQTLLEGGVIQARDLVEERQDEYGQQAAQH